MNLRSSWPFVLAILLILAGLALLLLRPHHKEFHDSNFQRGDTVSYRFSPNQEPVPRIVRGIPGDRFELLPDEAHGAWNLKINGELIMSGDQPYFFGGKDKPTLALYPS